MNAQQIADYVASHGFNTFLFPSGVVVFFIPCVNIHTGEQSEEIARVRTLREARIALGY